MNCTLWDTSSLSFFAFSDLPPRLDPSSLSDFSFVELRPLLGSSGKVRWSGLACSDFLLVWFASVLYLSICGELVVVPTIDWTFVLGSEAAWIVWTEFICALLLPTWSYDSMPMTDSILDAFFMMPLYFFFCSLREALRSRPLSRQHVDLHYCPILLNNIYYYIKGDGII